MKPAAVEGHGGCGNMQPQVRQAALQLKAAFEVVQEDGPKRKETVNITAEMAHGILRRISERDLRNMGLNTDYARPEWMVLTVLPVPFMYDFHPTACVGIGKGEIVANLDC